ncbi:hypothetical protein BH09ACT7_BH09ACT7_60900 [soil metagenome]
MIGPSPVTVLGDGRSRQDRRGGFTSLPAAEDTVALGARLGAQLRGPV